MMAACAPRISEVAAALPPRTRRRLYEAKALYRFLGNGRVSARAVLGRVCEQGLEGGELLALLDVSLLEKPYARAMEGLQPVGKGRVPGYELLTCLLLEGHGHLGLGHRHLLAYGERGVTSWPQEVLGPYPADISLVRGRGSASATWPIGGSTAASCSGWSWPWGRASWCGSSTTAAWTTAGGCGRWPRGSGFPIGPRPG